MQMIEKIKSAMAQMKADFAEQKEFMAQSRLEKFLDFPHKEDCPRQTGLFVSNNDARNSFSPEAIFGGPILITGVDLVCGDCHIEQFVRE